MDKSFVHLHCHTEYSMLDGAARIPASIEAVMQDGQPALGITDHGNLYGLLDHYGQCLKHGIQPILGMEAYQAENKRTERPKRPSGKEDLGLDVISTGSSKLYYHLLLLVENLTGYHNLMKLSTESFLSGYYYKPRIDWDLLTQYHEGLIATSGCLGGLVLQRLLQNDEEGALESAAHLQDIFGRDNFFIELQNHGIGEQFLTNPKLIEISKKIAAPLLATNDSHYVHQKDALPHDVLLCIQTKAKQSDEKRFKFSSDQHWLKTAAEMRYLFREAPEACDNTLWIAERAQLEIDPGDDYHLPQFIVPPEYASQAEYLRYLTLQGAKARYGDNYTQKVQERIDFELKVIEDMGFSGYFLVVWDLYRHAAQAGVQAGPGRGSAAGSAVSYCLRICQLDPIRYGLFFERFLNPGRRQMPDIDMDFDVQGRIEMLRYATEKYGTDKVAQIITFSTIKARAAVRDAARVLGYPYGVGDAISKAMPPLIMGRDTPLNACLELTPGHETGYARASALRQLYEDDPIAQKIVDVALGLEGLKRSDGIHGAAVLIGDRPLVEYMPLQQKVLSGGDPADFPIITQYSMHHATWLKLCKLDFLGLRNLSVLKDTCDLIRETAGITIDINEIDLEDAETYALLSRGDTVGVFQLESPQIRGLTKAIAPSSIEDVCALLALYRPGPMAANMHYTFADYKNHRKEVVYEHEDLKNIIGDTYGLMIYQESIMKVAQMMAGYSLAEADDLRKACGKKDKALIAKHRQQFVEGCQQHGYTEQLAIRLFDIIEPFSNYAFNKCVAGQTEVRLITSDGKTEAIRVDDFYKSFDADAEYRTLSLGEDGVLHPTVIRGVYYNGVRPVWRVRLADGFSIVATDNHRHMTEDGWRLVRDLRVGDRLLSVGEEFSSITPRAVVAVEYAGEVDVFDIEVDDVSHSWVGSGIVTHNSHALSYGFITYQTAWLKVHWPEHYMAALLTSVADEAERIEYYMSECNIMGLKILVPDINASGAAFSVINTGTEDKPDWEIRFGLSAVKGAGEGIVGAILSERQANGRFESFVEVCKRVDSRALNKSVMGSFINAGAFDAFGYTRRGLWEFYENNAGLLKGKAKEAMTEEPALFEVKEMGGDNLMAARVSDIEWPRMKKLELERTALSFFVSDHPLSKAQETLQSHCDTKISEILEDPETFADKTVRIGGLALSVTEKKTKRGATMATLQVCDIGASIEAVVFPQKWATISGHITATEIVVVSGRVQVKDNGISILTDDIKKLHIDREMDDPVDIVIDDAWDTYTAQDRQLLISRIKQVCAAYPGMSPVYVSRYSHERSKWVQMDLKKDAGVTTQFIGDLRLAIQQATDVMKTASVAHPQDTTDEQYL